MTTLQRTIGTTTGNLTANCVRRGYQGSGAKIVLVASDSSYIQNWLYEYLEPYGNRGYAFVFVEREYDFIEYARKHDTLMAFIEDTFFGDRILGKLENIKKDYPRLRLTVFSATHLPNDVAARYVCWSDGSYFSLRSREKEIQKRVIMIFDRQQTYPPDLIDDIHEYKQLSDKEPYLTPKEYEVVKSFSEGLKGKIIAPKIGVSERTLWTHAKNIRKKFGGHKMTKVISIAVSKGLLSAGSNQKRK